MVSAAASHAVATSSPAPHTVHAPQFPPPAAGLNVEPATHAVHVLGLPDASSPAKPAEHWHVRSVVAVHSVNFVVPSPHIVHALQLPSPGAALNVIPATQAVHDTEPLEDAKKPAEHAMHKALAVALVCPISHSWQPSALIPAAYMPAVQAAHVTEPAEEE